jgi:hypothetical protein
MLRSAVVLVLAPSLALGLAGAAGAYRYDVLEWSAAWEGFADDFEDGALPAGGPGEAPIYLPLCGVDGDDETGGALVLSGPDPLCPAGPGAVLATTGGTTVGETRATFRFAVPAPGQSYGLTLSDAGSTDTATLVVARSAVPPFVADGLLVALLADPAVAGVPTPVAFHVLSAEPPHDGVSAAAIELRLVTAAGPGGGVVPTGSFRLCASSPCEDEATTPFVTLPPSPLPHPDGGVLAPGLAHGPALVAFSLGGEPFSFAVEEWRTRGSAGDDFESAAFGAAAPYTFSCGTADDVAQAEGALSLHGPVASCGGNGLAFEAALPGPLAIQARFAFAVPGPCESYGVSAGAGDGDFAFLALARSEDPLDPGGGGEALVVRLTSESEPGGPWIPVVAAARVSGDPLGDPALADVRSIELQLELAVDPAGLVPAGRFRLCGEAGCPPDFTPLEPAAPAAEPDPLLCGVPASGYDPPADGGAIAFAGPVGAALTAVPEPAGGAGLALLAVVALRGMSRTAARRSR